MVVEISREAQNLIFLLILATAVCTLAGAWCAALSETVMVWLFLVISVSCGISFLVTLTLLPMVNGFTELVCLDAMLTGIVTFGAVRTWAGTLSMMGLA